MLPLREVYRQVACMDCRRLGHDEPWPCIDCLCRFADHAIRETVNAALERAAREADAVGARIAAVRIRSLKEPCGERPGGVG